MLKYINIDLVAEVSESIDAIFIGGITDFDVLSEFYFIA